MDYLKHYYKLIDTRKELDRKVYTEVHHIVPKSVYGKGLIDNKVIDHYDDARNLVRLTGREHFVAHWLLHRAFPKNRNLAAAFHAMASMSNKYHYRYTPSSRAVSEAREAYADLMKLPVAMYNLDGKLIKVFDTTEEASQELDTHVSNIAAACNEENNVNNIKGYQWRRFKGEPKKSIEPYINQNEEASLQVHEYNLKGKYVKSYGSIREANRNGVNRSGLRSSIRNKPMFVANKWYVLSNEAPKAVIKVKKKATQRRRVHQIDPKTGKVIRTWESSREPQRVLGIANVSSVCNGKRKTMGGFIWKYAEEEYDLNLDNHKRGLAKAKKIRIVKEGKVLGSFDSLREAERKTGIARHTLAKLLKTKPKESDIKIEILD